MSHATRSYYWLCLGLAVPAFIWLVPTLWMLSLSFQPNDVLARTTASTSCGMALRSVAYHAVTTSDRPSSTATYTA